MEHLYHRKDIKKLLCIESGHLTYVDFTIIIIIMVEENDDNCFYVRGMRLDFKTNLIALESPSTIEVFLASQMSIDSAENTIRLSHTIRTICTLLCTKDECTP